MTSGKTPASQCLNVTWQLVLVSTQHRLDDFTNIKSCLLSAAVDQQHHLLHPFFTGVQPVTVVFHRHRGPYMLASSTGLGFCPLPGFCHFSNQNQQVTPIWSLPNPFGKWDQTSFKYILSAKEQDHRERIPFHWCPVFHLFCTGSLFKLFKNRSEEVHKWNFKVHKLPEHSLHCCGNITRQISPVAHSTSPYPSSVTCC